MDNLLNEWEEFFQGARDCEVCQRKFKLPAVNILKEVTSPREAWGLPWYDRYRNLDGGLMVVGKDFGNEKMVSDFRAELARNPRFEPGWDQDRSYFRLRKFLGEVSIACRGFVTNSALCVRPNAAKITGDMRSKVYANCLCHLKRQINLVKPYVIAPLGPVALKWVCIALKQPIPKGGITKIAGKPIPAPANDTVVQIIPLIHPAMAQKGWTDARQRGELYGVLKQALDKMDTTTTRREFRELFGNLD